nr:acyl-CoA thioesterase domain-containing protein [Brucella suis]
MGNGSARSKSSRSRSPIISRARSWSRCSMSGCGQGGLVPDDRALQAAILAYLSDMTLLDTSLHPHGRFIFDRDMQVASLDHAMWFHRPCRLDDWLLYTQDAPSASGARGFNRGALYTRDGVLIASVAQEGLIRVHEKNK